MTEQIEIRIRTLTPLWTGDVNRRCRKLKETGIIGSLRWWYEALVRGLGGYACDPTSNERCELKQDKFSEAIKSGESIQEALDEQICPACQLFGCTSWKKKVKFEIRNVNGKFSGDGFEGEFNISMKELKPMSGKDKWLLVKTIELISNYGSIGGRTTRKPQPNPIAGKDYGLIKVLNVNIKSDAKKEDVENWLKNSSKKLNKKNNGEWPNLEYFFFIKGKYLNRIQINELMRSVPYLEGKMRMQEDLGRSKRIFSFKADNGRIWGYVRDEDMLKEVINYLETKFKISDIKKFEDVLK